MAQTTDAISFVAATVEYNTTGTTWTAMSGFSASVAMSGGDRNTGEAYTFDGDTPIVRAGKRTPIDVMVRYVYTEGASDPFEILRAQYETAGGAQCNIRWSPIGTSGDFLYTSDTATNGSHLVTFPYPGGEAEPGDPVLLEFVVRTQDITKATVA